MAPELLQFGELFEVVFERDDEVRPERGSFEMHDVFRLDVMQQLLVVTVVHEIVDIHFLADVDITIVEQGKTILI